MNSDKTSEETKQGIRRMQKHTMTSILEGHAQSTADRMVAEAFGASAEALRDIRQREQPGFIEEHGISADYVGQVSSRLDLFRCVQLPTAADLPQLPDPRNASLRPSRPSLRPSSLHSKPLLQPQRKCSHGRPIDISAFSRPYQKGRRDLPLVHRPHKSLHSPTS